MSTTLPRPRPAPPAREAPAAEPASKPGSRAFELGVAACTAAVAVFLAVQLDSWPPHEDETLALFVGRQSIPDLFDTVLGHRGGAPLHFLIAWVVAHLGGGLLALRAFSAVFATASIPAVAILGRRLAGRSPALVATVVVSASWALLFHGIYARMYSLFLLTSTLSYLALLRAMRRNRPLDWALWAAAVILAVAAHPFGALVLASQSLFVLLERTRIRTAFPAFLAVALLGIPFWRSDLVLAGRFDVGIGGGGSKLDGPGSVLLYLWHAAGDFTAAYLLVLVPTLLVAALGLWTLRRDRPQDALLSALVIATPAAMLLAGRFGSSTSPETRHLIFAFPFVALCLAVGLLRFGPVVAIAALVVLVPAEIQWGEQKTPQLYGGESEVRVHARAEASAWLARTSRPDDVLFGYDPLFLQAWERGGDVSRIVIPRADPHLAFDALRRAPKPLGRGVWIFDASDTNNFSRRMSIRLRSPYPPSAFEVRTFGPFLVIRSRLPTRTIGAYLAQAWDVELVGRSLYIGDADVNYDTVRRAIRRFAVS